MVKVQTVKGAISPNELGVTLPHEHLLVDFRSLVQEPDKVSEKWIVDTPISIENLELFQTGREISETNLYITDINLAATELSWFKYYGGNSIIEVTPIGCGRDPLGLRKISELSGINIVCSTGWYKAYSHPNYIKTTNIDELCSIMISELTRGIGEIGIKAGIIKCACNTPTHPDEQKILQVAAQAQKETGAPLTIHTHRLPVASKPIENVMDTIIREGANIEKISICHMDTFLFGEKGWTLPIDYHKSLMDEFDVFLNFDMFGKNQYIKFPSLYWDDRKRVAAVVELCQQGYDKQILLSHDICYKMHLKSFGGYGYGQVMKYIIPELKYHGVTDKQINNLLIENSKRLLAF